MTATALSPISIVLVEPAGALNVGSVARIMANLGLSRLLLVNPQCDPLCDEARQMAVHAQEILEGAIYALVNLKITKDQRPVFVGNAVCCTTSVFA